MRGVHLVQVQIHIAGKLCAQPFRQEDCVRQERSAGGVDRTGSKDVAGLRQRIVDAGLLQPLRDRRSGLAWIDLKIHRQVHPSDDVFPGDR